MMSAIFEDVQGAMSCNAICCLCNGLKLEKLDQHFKISILCLKNSLLEISKQQ